MAISLANLRGKIVSKVSALDGFNETRMSPAFFARTQDSIAHLAFSVGMDTSTAATERQRRAIGVYVNSPIVVTFAYRLRPLDINLDYNNAMNSEQSVLSAVLGSYASDAGDSHFTIEYISSIREVTDSQEYIIITLNFNTLHTLT